jgi:hypothetical protein
VPKRLCKRKRRRVLKHLSIRGEERYGGIKREEIDRLHSIHRQDEAIPVGNNEFVNWLTDGRRVRYIFLRNVGIVTFLPLRNRELSHVRY